MSHDDKTDTPLDAVDDAVEETAEAVMQEPTEPAVEDVEPAPADPPKQPGRGLSLIAIAVSLVALLGVGAGGWMAGQQSGAAQSAQSDLAAQLASLQARVDGLGSPGADISALQVDLARIDASQQQVFAAAEGASTTSQNVTEQLSSMVGDLADTRTRIELIEGNRAQEYLLAEVEYLMRIAIQRVQAGRDVATGLSLLLSADQALASADDASLFPVRKALAAEIAALRAVPGLDRTGLYLKLSAAAEQVDNLRMSPAEVDTAPVVESTDAIDGAMKTLASFVTVRRRDNPVQPMLAPTEAAYVRQNLRLMMEQSQLALLDGDAGTWQASLTRAQDWVGRYFLASDTQTTALLETLAPLGSINIAPDLPSMGGSLNALRAVQQARVDALVGGE
ncbi:uroporphyrinogen-III C-methyltransferase [Litorivicinus lipolyticus]|uniref:uroporphyrinogen-III C-methyltransferase n=1 Tax=Litorivicinus lipolyticus TaxID=418701 RepID=UPI003B590A53